MTLTKKLLNGNIHIVEGNSKLTGADDCAFLIFNIMSQDTCPYKTAICNHVCYAASEERRFPSVRKSRTENQFESYKDTFVNDMINHIEYQLQRNKYLNKKIYFRIHSSGDFYNEIYFDKWVEITDFFKWNENIIFEAYTKSLPYIKQPESINITLVYSVMPDTKQEDIDRAKQLGLKTFNALPIGQLPAEGFKCGGNCGKCNACYIKDNGIQDIYTEFHGSRAKSKLLKELMDI